jgi:light-regulated signal transduction histidine kinase (bacteriophytochrome)
VGKLDKRADDWIDRITQSTHKMQALITDLLQYSRVDSRSAQLSPVSLQEAFNAALGFLRPVIEESGASVTASELPVIIGNRIQLTQLLQNLIGNSLKYCEKQPEVHVAARKTAEMWEVSVSDNGIGMDPKYHRKIFEIFGRLHGDQEYSGTGLGLALCRRIAERHGGAIRVDSRLGEGSTFYVSLPAGEANHA